MTTLQIIVLALVQGVTEFLPISSSAHLILVNQAMGYQDQGLVFDVAAHVGSLLAVIVYFRRELLDMLLGRPVDGFGVELAGHRLLGWLVLATLPLGVAGLALAETVAAHARTPLVIALATIAFALVLWWSDRYAGSRPLTARKALGMGLAQVLALVPGTSRSGITITAGLFLGMSRRAAARFSFLMAIPAVLAAGLFGAHELLQAQLTPHWGQFALAMAVAGVSAYLCIAAFIRLVEQIGMLPFVIYRLFLGGLILGLLL